MTRYQFEQVAMRRSLSGYCPRCGKRTKRSMKFIQTINPFNRNTDGSIKTFDEVLVDVRAEADSWVPNFTHEACEVEA